MRHKTQGRLVAHRAMYEFIGVHNIEYEAEKLYKKTYDTHEMISRTCRQQPMHMTLSELLPTLSSSAIFQDHSQKVLPTNSNVNALKNRVVEEKKRIKRQPTVKRRHHRSKNEGQHNLHSNNHHNRHIMWCSRHNISTA